jgi:hypothetical protein
MIIDHPLLIYKLRGTYLLPLSDSRGGSTDGKEGTENHPPTGINQERLTNLPISQI